MNRYPKRIHLYHGDITTITADALVNAANSTLLGGSGVDGAIHQAGGPDIIQECRDIRHRCLPDGLPAGQAVYTNAGKLSSRYVIHTVGPIWNDGRRGEPELLRSAYTQSLILAETLFLDSIAFPAISTGAYGYPPQEAARVTSQALEEWCAHHPHPEHIILVFHTIKQLHQFTTATGWESGNDPTQTPWINQID